MATNLDEKTQQKRVSTLLSVIGQDAKDIWQNHPWTDDVEDRYRIEPVLQMYEDFCTPRVNVPYERFCASSCRYQTDSIGCYVSCVYSNRKGMQTLPCISEMCNGARKLCKLGET